MWATSVVKMKGIFYFSLADTDSLQQHFRESRILRPPNPISRFNCNPESRSLL